MAVIVRPPGPPCPFLGVPLFSAAQRNPYGFMEDLRSRYGDVVYLRLGFEHIYFLFHPDDVRMVFATHYDQFVKGRGVRRKGKLMGEGLLTGEGEYHRQQRRMMMPAFSRTAIHEHAAVIMTSASELADRWSRGATIELFDELRRLTMRIATRTFFGAESDGELDEIMAAIQMIDDLQFRIFRLPFAQLRDKLPNPKLAAARRRLESALQRLISERRARGPAGNDMLGLLLQAQRDGGHELMTDRDVLDHVVTVAMTSETAAVALMWTFFALSKHPEIERRVHAEIDRAIGQRPPDVEDLANLPYTERVFTEAIRLYPPAWRLMRKALKDVDVGGYTVPAGSLVVFSQFMIHRDERFYPNPLLFDPERWTAEGRTSRPAHAFFPFGGGPRRCIGENFGWLEGMLLLATLAGRCRLRLRPGAEARLRPAPLLRVRPDLQMIVEPRDAYRPEAMGASASGSMAMRCPAGAELAE